MSDEKQVLADLVSPLEAFYERVDERGPSLCFVQPGSGGQVTEYSWNDVDSEVRRMAAHIRSLGFPEGSRIALFSKNCAHWIMADLAIWLAGHVTVPIYPTLTGQSVEQIMTHSEAVAIFAGGIENWQEVAPVIPASMPGISFPSSPSAVKERFPNWVDIIAEQSPFTENFKPDLDALATIIYTSGTTGVPKGVMHSFRTMGATAVLVGEVYDSADHDRFLSYLPLAHAAERACVEICQLYAGFTVYFCYSLDTFAVDLKRAAPTLFFAVPRIWMKLQQGVYGKISAGLLGFILKVPLLSSFMGRNILDKMGLGNVRIGLSGAAPLSTTLLAWYRSIGLEILEGYGMSENFAYSHTSRVGEAKIGYVGKANPLVDCKIDDNGEIIIRTPTNMLGYYKAPELTQEVFTEDGFLRTGDMGEIDPQGRLRITGRVKELFKTSKGKYVAPAPIENLLLVEPMIEQVCVTGASLPKPLALLNLSDTARNKLQDDSARAEIVETLEKLLTETNLKLDKHENLQCLIVVPEVWGVENNFTTPTLKIRRNNIDQHYASSFDEWSQAGAKVIVL